MYNESRIVDTNKIGFFFSIKGCRLDYISRILVSQVRLTKICRISLIRVHIRSPIVIHKIVFLAYFGLGLELKIST